MRTIGIGSAKPLPKAYYNSPSLRVKCFFVGVPNSAFDRFYDSRITMVPVIASCQERLPVVNATQ